MRGEREDAQVSNDSVVGIVRSDSGDGGRVDLVMPRSFDRLVRRVQNDVGLAVLAHDLQRDAVAFLQLQRLDLLDDRLAVLERLNDGDETAGEIFSLRA